MELALGMTFFFIIITMIFVAVAIFLPEWIGITGKKAKEVISEQQGDSAPPSMESTSTEAPTSAPSPDKVKPHQ